MTKRKQANPLWDNDEIQFARLLCEIMAACDIDIRELTEPMDLQESDIEELFSRADVAWEKCKREHCPARSTTCQH